MPFAGDSSGNGLVSMVDKVMLCVSKPLCQLVSSNPLKAGEQLARMQAAIQSLALLSPECGYSSLPAIVCVPLCFCICDFTACKNSLSGHCGSPGNKSVLDPRKWFKTLRRQSLIMKLC